MKAEEDRKDLLDIITGLSGPSMTSAGHKLEMGTNQNINSDHDGN